MIYALYRGVFNGMDGGRVGGLTLSFNSKVVHLEAIWSRIQRHCHTLKRAWVALY